MIGFARGLVRVRARRSRPCLQPGVRDNVRLYGDVPAQPTDSLATSTTALGARVKALREAMNLSLRDLAERSGVSAPMLSQVERGETSPTLQVAGRIAAGLDLRLSQLLRLDEERRGDASSARAERRKGPGGGAPRPPLRDPDAAAARPARRALAPHARRRAPSPAARATRRCTSPAAARPRSSSPARSCCVCDGERHELAAGDCVTFDADLPHHFENPGPEEASPARRRQCRPTKELSTCRNPVRQDLGRPRGGARPAVHRPAPRPRGHQPAGVRRAAARGPRRCAVPTARSPPPTTTCRPTARPSPRGSTTSSRACRSRRSSATARSSGFPSTRSAPSTRGSST